MDDLEKYIVKRKKTDPKFAKSFEKGFKKIKIGIKRAVKYTDGPIGKIKIVKDFLPPPDQLSFVKGTVKVTGKKQSKKFLKGSNSTS